MGPKPDNFEENEYSYQVSQADILINTLPRQVRVAPTSTQVQSAIIECTALPRKVISDLAWVDNLPTSCLRAISQWQLDLPLSTASDLITPKPWIAVIEKILKRGRAVPLSPELENELWEIAPTQVPTDWSNWYDALLRISHADRPPPNWHEGFDSEEEQTFFDLVCDFANGHASGWLHRQVDYDALTYSSEATATNQRIDFFFAHPSGVHIAIEIDGAQHQRKRLADIRRDKDIRTAGFNVLRIPASEIRQGTGPSLKRLHNIISDISRLDASSDLCLYIRLIRRAHQVQLALWQAMITGAITFREEQTIGVTVLLDHDFDERTTGLFTSAVLKDLNKLVSDVGSLYSIEHPIAFEKRDQGDICVSFEPSFVMPNAPIIYVRDTYLPISISSDISPSSPANASSIDRYACERLLTRIFGFESFVEGQFEAVEQSLSGEDAIILLPTGAGKSVAFQLASMLRPGVCIVIDPILSLMEDQIDNLRAFGIDRICQITHAIEGPKREAILELLAKGEFIFCYVAPERFQSQLFRESLRTLTTYTAISLVTIDEAHCVSEWGHDFRPAYLNIARISRDYCATQGNAPPLMALTGTASRSVLKDVQRELAIDRYESIITPKTFDRSELRFQTSPCRSDEKMQVLRGVLQAMPAKFGYTQLAFFQPNGEKTPCGLVFCPHVNGEYGVVQISRELSRWLNRKVPFYSGGAPKGMDDAYWQKERQRIAADFKRNRVALMACTKAFGMGIDKPNIRYTVHYGLPPSIESFYQEAGRAGRDRRESLCTLIYSNDFRERTKRLLAPSLDINELHRETDKLDWTRQDDITRALWFHNRCFSGMEVDYRELQAVIQQIGDLSQPGNATIRFESNPKDDKLHKERAIYRLLTLGVVRDYTVDYSAREFRIRLSGIENEQVLEDLVRYVGAYQRGQAKIVEERIRRSIDIDHEAFIKLAARELIQFVYGVIERGRRQALSEALALCEECLDEKSIRERLLLYLGTSVFTEGIELILDASEAGLDEVIEVLTTVRSALDASHLRGESGRALESYPDHAGLRLLRAISEAMTLTPDQSTISENVQASVRFGISKYGTSVEKLITTIADTIRLSADPRPAIAEPIINGLITASEDKRLVARMLLELLPARLAKHAAWALIGLMNIEVHSLLEVR